MNRIILKEEGDFFNTLITFFILFGSALIILYHNIGKITFIIYSIVLIFFCVFTYEREPIVFLLLVFVFNYKKKLNLFYVLPIGIVGLYVLAYFKAFYLILLAGKDFSVFSDYIVSNPVSLSKLDPLASFGLIYDYFESKPLFYDNFNFTYLTSFYDYFITYQKKTTMANAASTFYVGDSYGLAFSMILESIINFSFIGPIFIAVIFKLTYTFLKKRFMKLNLLIDLMCVMFFLSFVRTEFIVMSKIFVLPMILFLIMIKLFSNINNFKFK